MSFADSYRIEVTQWPDGHVLYRVEVLVCNLMGMQAWNKIGSDFKNEEDARKFAALCHRNRNMEPTKRYISFEQDS